MINTWALKALPFVTSLIIIILSYIKIIYTIYIYTNPDRKLDEAGVLAPALLPTHTCTQLLTCDATINLQKLTALSANYHAAQNTENVYPI